jgi:hypothetical protein
MWVRIDAVEDLRRAEEVGVGDGGNRENDAGKQGKKGSYRH